MPRPITAFINSSALAHNLTLLKQQKPQARCMAVIKANAYGHHLECVWPGLQQADALGLLELDQAARVRTLGWTKPIVLLEGCFDAADVRQAMDLKCDFVIHSWGQLDLLKQYLASQGSNTPQNQVIDQGLAVSQGPVVYLKLNTGMNRLGFVESDWEQAQAELEQLVLKHQWPQPVLMTHFANSDAAVLNEGPVQLGQQYARLVQANRRGWKISAGNSAAVLESPEKAGDIMRPGIAIYGATPGPHSAAYYGLKPVMTLQSEVIAIQPVKKGSHVGYGSRWQAPSDTTVAIVACGYADGYPRHAPDGTPVWIHGQKMPLAGRVSMDMLMVDVGLHSGVQPGTIVQLWGDQLPVDEVATACGTIGYELLCAVAPRVRFVGKP